MRNSIKRFSKRRRNLLNSDFDRQENDVYLADINVMPDDSQLRITPLNHDVDDEDNFDRLLADDRFGSISADPIQPDDNVTIIDNIPAAAGHGRIMQGHLHGPEIPFEEISQNKPDTQANSAIGLANPMFGSTSVAINIAEDNDGIVDLGVATDADANAFIAAGGFRVDAGEMATDSKSPSNATLPRLQHSHPNRLLLFVVCVNVAVTCLLGVMIYGLETEVGRLTAQIVAISEKLAAKQ